MLIDLDEWQHFFSKAGIENSSLTSFLHTAFYKRRQNVIVGRGKEIDVDCALIFIGGIVEDEFDTCIGVNSMGGLHDRFAFGLHAALLSQATCLALRTRFFSSHGAEVHGRAVTLHRKKCRTSQIWRSSILSIRRFRRWSSSSNASTRYGLPRASATNVDEATSSPTGSRGSDSRESCRG